MNATSSSSIEKKIIESATRLAKKASLVITPKDADYFFTETVSTLKKTPTLYDDLTRQVRITKHLTHEVEWVFDNFYIVQGAVTDILQSLRKKDLRTIPQQKIGESFKPRIQIILQELLRLDDYTLDKETLELFLRSYQRQAPLSVKELHLVPGTLKILLLAKVDQLIKKLTASLVEYKEAGEWFEKIQKILEHPSPDFSDLTSDLTKHYGIIPIRVGYYLLERLHEIGSKSRPLIKWLRLNFLKQGIRLEDLGDRENEERTTIAEGLSKCIDSLRWLNQIRWDTFVSEVNSIDAVLRQDPAGAYAFMDEQSQEQYRNIIVHLGDESGIQETEIAKSALELAKLNTHHNHIGYYLIDDGRVLLEKKLDYKVPFSNRLYRFILNHATALYLGTILGADAVLTFFGVLLIYRQLSFVSTLVFLVLGFLAMSDPVMHVVNTLATRFLPIRSPSRLDLRKKIPDEARTFVAIPSMLRSVDANRELARQLEVHYLANTNSNIFFALLMDFKDAPKQNMEGDDALVASIEEIIAGLNKKYFHEDHNRFHILYRRRLWNDREGMWMGFERKRGKLREFNEVLRGSTNTSYVTFDSLQKIPRVTYVITLDEDTVLPPEAAFQLIGTIHHPLNRPVVKDGRVVQGYAIIQPHITVRLQSAMKSGFSRLFSFAVGIDSYTRPIANVYQDLFGAGIFYGKGIYDIDSVEATMAGRIPSNTVLSHDLLEGIYARTGYASDIQLFDKFPSNYYEYAVRGARWIRGDWQIIPWLKRASHFSVIDQWKIIDNIRRSLITPTLLAIILLSWFVLPLVRSTLTVYVLILLGGSFVFSFLLDFFSWGYGTTLRFKLKVVSQDFITAISHIFLRASMLFSSGLTEITAVVTAVVRMTITRRHLLQWQTAYEVSGKLKGSLLEMYRKLWQSWIFSGVVIFIAIKLGVTNPAVFLWCTIWFLSPLVAYAVSLPRYEEIVMSKKNQQFLRRVALRSELFFLELSNKEHNFLIPDHFQEEPAVTSAYSTVSTSPTNIGMLLTSLFAAYDFGHLSLADLISRLKRTMATLDTLPRFKGHFFNWYDIKRLEPLNPNYVSSVDSANFLLALLALDQGLEQVLNNSTAEIVKYEGMNDVIVLVLDDAIALRKKVPRHSVLQEIITDLKKASALITSISDSEKNTKTETLLKELQIINIRMLSYAPELRLVFGDLSIRLRRGLDHINRLVHDSVSMKALGISPELRSDIEKIIHTSRRFFDEAEFGFLYNKERGLFHIGYNATFNKIDNAYYDFLASEANAVSFISIVKKQVPQKHWFYLGRKLVQVGSKESLYSWGGSLFEYLTSLIFFQTHPESLLGASAQVAVHAHERYARIAKTAWGMGESAFYSFDIHNNYQYQIFGDPNLGLKRGLEDSLVVAPYTTALSLYISPKSGLRNLKRLIKEKVFKTYGFYDAIDYTAARGIFRKKGKPVKIYYAHHLGFSIASISNVLQSRRFQKLFHAHPRVQAAEVIFDETVPRSPAIAPIKNIREFSADYTTARDVGGKAHYYVPARTREPRYAFLGNGTYSVVQSNSGSGFSRYKDVDITRYRDDQIAESWGTHFFIKDEADNSVWSPTLDPLKTESKGGKIIFSENKVEYIHQVSGIQTRLEVTVPPGDPLEIRRFTITNLGKEERTLSITSYAELALAKHQDDLNHPAFHKLFVTSEVLPNQKALIVHRAGPKDADKSSLYAAHFISTAAVGDVKFTRSREEFLTAHKDLIESSPYTLDTCLSIEKNIVILPGKTVVLSFNTAAAPTKTELLKIIDKYSNPKANTTALGATDERSVVTARNFGTSIKNILAFQELLSSMFSSQKLHSFPERVIEVGKISESYVQSLWRAGISGDLPYVLLRVKDIQDVAIVKQILLLNRYALYKGIDIDIVILNDYPASYIKIFDDEIDFLIRVSKTVATTHMRGTIFHLKSDLMSPQDKEMIISLARVVLSGSDGSIEQQIHALTDTARLKLPKKLTTIKRPQYSRKKLTLPNTLTLKNGIGGFDLAKREYGFILDKSVELAKPWVNIIANPHFGTIVTHRGTGFTWSEDSYDNRLTAFDPDPLQDRGSERLYLRDEETGELWSPMPLYLQAISSYYVRHGLGYSVFEHVRSGIETELLITVPQNDAVKISRVTFKNTTERERKLSLTNYLEPVLGVNREGTKHLLHFEQNENGSILVMNPVRNNFNDRVAVAHITGDIVSVTTSKEEFIGRGSTIDSPAALRRENLSNTIVDGSESCIAMQSFITLKPGEEKEIIVLLGEADTKHNAVELIKKYSGTVSVKDTLQTIKEFWQAQMPITITSPDPALDALVNNFLVYQMVSSRLFGKTGYYQPGGAFGFRDQLQDVMALVMTDPARTRAMILEAAKHQFEEGDVMGWWHEHNNFGLRNLFADQHLWLAHVTNFYIQKTDDTKLLDESVSFAKASLVSPEGEKEWTGVPQVGEFGSIYEHCVRAIDRSLNFGEHGLPFMLAGDWNDGLNKVGPEGVGESVWLAWFLAGILSQFEMIARSRKDIERADRYKETCESLKKSLDKTWDGEWYRRAYMDDGTVLGSKGNKEFTIDSIAQSWSVLSNAGESDKQIKAMQSAIENLTTSDGIRLLAPPLGTGPLNPGYIKNYPPGVRENGAQYNHGALWAAQALSILGNGNEAKKLLDLVNPVTRSADKTKAGIYRSEPYIVSSEVYLSPSYPGRGGWTWYTASAGVFYRTVLEYLFGLNIHGTELPINPCLPTDWKKCSLEYKYKTSTYVINIKNPKGISKGVASLTLDNLPITNKKISLKDDGMIHEVVVTLG